MVRAPDFRPELEWINTGGRALKLADFRGRVLILDFWTYGCINCIHVIPELAEIERRFPDQVSVVGVHSGKFVNERITTNIARACERLGVHHPVVNDRQFRTWREYTVNAWPTLVVVTPTGYVVGNHPGEIEADQLAPVVERLIEEARTAGGPSPASNPFMETPSLAPFPGELRFPAKLIAPAPDRLFVADTGHHRVVEVALSDDGASGRVVRVIGNGEAGWADGPGAHARFRSPQGLALAGETLYIADTENHLVRAVDLATEQVTTVAGTGVQSRRRTGGGPAREVPLNSPWDLLWEDGALYIAMAGWHQLWRLDVGTARSEIFAGSGAEELHDAPLAAAALAQPSGLASDGERIYFADPESSAVRRASEREGVRTIVGTGLFEFGDRDGIGDEARLQHAIGVAWWRARKALLVADCYNHRIRVVDPEVREARGFAGSGAVGSRDGAAEEASFWEPGGIAITPDERRAYVADTNNHLLRMIDLTSRQVTTVSL